MSLHFRNAADLALVGILVTLLSLPVVTAGAAVGAGSAAVYHLVAYGRWPSFVEVWSSFRSRLVRGLWVGPVVLVAGGLVAADIAALRRGAVPGGAVATTLVVTAAAFGAAFLALLAVRAGGAVVTYRPVTVCAAAGILLVAAVLAVFVHPVLVPVLAGYVLFALHVVVRAPHGVRTS
ncbi:DUF624 domain-containing protein [Actinoplanes sp. TBRC 11911]|uniref:DUF624 domain-containing protein n=1 Tax=Actinoplanes sp. TBRC 11911 TaxID=2729386 RepID=UPI00145CEB80|nr:DUF624 domain-containing protein [Actinoplanes sp. TBRC 11911]NMO54755.1 DUF624 domain-containing protein [Actinoplanes sp. TBRC 11911]